MTNYLIGQLQREGFIIQKASNGRSSTCRRTKFAFDAVLNEITVQKRRDIFSNRYFDEIFLQSDHVPPTTDNKRKPDLLDTVQEDCISFSGVGQKQIALNNMMSQPKKRKVSIARKALVVL